MYSLNLNNANNANNANNNSPGGAGGHEVVGMKSNIAARS